MKKIIGAAILAASAFVSMAANANQAVSCSASGEFGGRQAATVYVSPRDPSVCIRFKLGGPSLLSAPDCWTAVRIYNLPCIDETGRPNIVDAN